MQSSRGHLLSMHTLRVDILIHSGLPQAYEADSPNATLPVPSQLPGMETDLKSPHQSMSVGLSSWYSFLPLPPSHLKRGLM